MINKLFGMHDQHSSVFSQAPVGSVRFWDVGVTWRDLETSPGVWDFTHMDALVDEARAVGARITYVLGRNPAFYAAVQTDCPPLDKYDNYVRTVMARYKGRIDSYQVWNETNISTYWTGTQAQAAQLTDIVWAARNDIDTAALVVAPSGPMRQKYQRVAYREYLSLVNKSHIDAYAFSMYPLPDLGPEGFYDLIGTVRNVLADYGEQDKPLWASEINYGVGSQTYTSGLTPLLSDTDQAVQVMKTYAIAKGLKLERCFWYRWDLPLYSATGVTPQMSIANTVLMTPWSPGTVPNLGATVAGQAYARVVDWLVGTVNNFFIDTDGTYKLTLNNNGVFNKIFWNPDRGVHVNVQPKVRRTFWNGSSAVLTDGDVWVTNNLMFVEPL